IALLTPIVSNKGGRCHFVREHLTVVEAKQDLTQRATIPSPRRARRLRALSRGHIGVTFNRCPTATATKRLIRRMTTMKRTATALVLAGVVLLGSNHWLISGQQSAGQPQRQGQPPAAAPGQGNFSTVTKAQYEQWMKQYSNSGRWGKDDEKGALN